MVGATRDRFLFRIKRSKQAVCIFIRALLPRTVWIGKIHFAAKPLLDLAPVRKFRSPVAGDRFDQLRRELRECRNDRVLHSLGSSVGHFDRNVKPRLALCQSRKASLALSLTAYDRVCFLVSGFFAAVYGFVALAYGFALLYLPRVSFTPWFFPLRRSTFRFPFTRYFSYIQRYIVRPARHLQAARCAGNLLR